jgi:dephospho-CoA kinase
MIIGLTGLIGSGKSKASVIFAQCGFDIIDTDIIANNILHGQAKQQVIEVFGSNILNSDGSINNNKLRDLVFTDDDYLKLLESILHPLIFLEVKQTIAAIINKNSKIIVVVPLLFKHPEYLTLINRSLLIDCNYELILNRLLIRGLNNSQVDAIIAKQMPIEQQRKLSDDIITNNSTEQEFITKIIIQSEYYRK